MHEIAFGSILGIEHARVGRNNQDAACVRVFGDQIVAVVCDGCSSGIPGHPSHNEVGAQLGARIVASAIVAQLNDTGDVDWWKLANDTTASLRFVLASMGAATADSADVGTVLDMFLFTTVIAVVGARKATFAALGDGAVFVNGEPIRFGGFPGNMPPYLGYRLIPSQISPDLLWFSVLKEMPAAELDSFLVGSDGVEYLVAAGERPMPGGTLPVGDISLLWTEDRYFKNPDAIRRRLTLVNGGVERRHPGYLKDDTTLVVGRRRHA
jgi:hypothetical protein